MKLQKKVINIFDYGTDFLALLAAVLLIFITLSITTGVVTRYLLNAPIIWILEISEYSLLFITFLGAAWVLRREQHVKMDMVLNRLGPRSQALLNSITSMLSAFVCLVVVWYSIQATWNYFELGYYTPTILRVPQGPIVIIIPIGTFMLSIQFLRRTYGYWRRWRVPQVKQSTDAKGS